MTDPNVHNVTSLPKEARRHRLVRNLKSNAKLAGAATAATTAVVLGAAYGARMGVNGARVDVHFDNMEEFIDAIKDRINEKTDSVKE